MGWHEWLFLIMKVGAGLTALGVLTLATAAFVVVVAYMTGFLDGLQ